MEGLPEEILDMILGFVVDPPDVVKTSLVCHNWARILCDSRGKLVKYAGHPRFDMCAYAAGLGELHVLRWLRKNGFFWDRRVLGYDAGLWCWDVLKWVHEEGWCSFDEELCASVARQGRMVVLEWLWDNGCPFGDRVVEEAAEGGHLEILKWLRKRGCPFKIDIGVIAAVCGYLDMLEWVENEGFHLGKHASRLAAFNGQIEVLEWLSKRTTFDKKTCRYAVVGNELSTLSWLRARGCPWDEYTEKWGAELGYVEK